MGSYRLTRADKVCKKQEYISAYKTGRRAETRNFRVFVSQNVLGIPRMGIGISRRIKGAVKRNRIKRLLREFFRLNRACFKTSNDYIFSVKKLPANLNYRDFEDELKSLPFIRKC